MPGRMEAGIAGNNKNSQQTWGVTTDFNTLVASYNYDGYL